MNRFIIPLSMVGILQTACSYGLGSRDSQKRLINWRWGQNHRSFDLETWQQFVDMQTFPVTPLRLARKHMLWYPHACPPLTANSLQQVEKGTWKGCIWNSVLFYWTIFALKVWVQFKLGLRRGFLPNRSRCVGSGRAGSLVSRRLQFTAMQGHTDVSSGKVLLRFLF